MSAPCMSVTTGSASSAEAGTSTFCFLLVPEMILSDRLSGIATVWWLTSCLCACRTAKVWKNWQLEYTLKGHEQSVWAVLALDGPEDDLVLTGKHPLHPERSTFATVELTLDCRHTRTGAADNLVRLFRGDKLVKTFRGHTQAVRALAKLDKSAGGGVGEDWFASGSNDG